MAYASLVRSTSGLLLLPALACSTADGLDTGSGGTAGQDPSVPDEPLPDPDGNACGLLYHQDSDFGAELRLDLAGSHVNRAPRAAIRRLDLPLGCDEPVAFEAASVDPDGDAMQHYWWTPDGMAHASSTELVLSPGVHRIVLLSVDARGSYDATSLALTRRCT